jgi:hypothetical protein
MAVRLIDHCQRARVLISGDSRLIDVCRNPANFAHAEWLLAWYGESHCSTPTYARSELQAFRKWREEGCQLPPGLISA